MNDDCGLPHSNPLFDFNPVECNEVNNIITSLRNNTAAGYDGLNVHMIKTVEETITEPLTLIINNIFATSTFPDELKIARIKPIFKGGDKNIATNYRPISVLPVLSKPVEKIMNRQINEYIDSNSIINKRQYGFTNSSNTTAACIDFVNSVQTSLDNGNATSCISLDLQKAFDTVQHKMLLRILYSYRFSSNAVQLISNYLTRRKQFILFNGKKSDEMTVRCGVPQGSVLGPTLFNLYINGLFDLQLSGKLIMYADDAILVYSSINDGELVTNMQNDLNIISTWLITHHLNINYTKSFYVMFGRRESTNYHISVGTSILKREYKLKYLGLTVTHNMCWNEHIDALKKSISPYIFVLHKLCGIVTRQVQYMIYYSYIHSKLLYMNSVWSSAPAYKMHELEILQNRAIKAIHRLPRLTPSIGLYTERVLPLEVLVKYEMVVLFKKMTTGRIRHNLDLQWNSEIHRYETRNTDSLHLPLIHTTRGGNGILFRGLLLYNSIPAAIRAMASLEGFKAKIREYLFQVWMDTR